MVRRLLLAAILLLSHPALAMAENHEIGPDNIRVGFSIRYLLVARVTGGFADIHGSFALDPVTQELDAIDVTIGTASINTGSPRRDRDLRGEDFFWTARYPAMHFQGSHAVRTGPHTGRVVGELTLRGVTRPVALDVTLGDHAATAVTSIRRGEFGMRPGLASLFIADRVDIRIEITGLPGGTGPAGGGPPPPA